MKLLSLLPADKYIVVNKTVLTEEDKKVLLNLYEPIIGFAAVSLYLTLWSDLDKLEIMSLDYNHHHLMSILKTDLSVIKCARESLESFGLLKSFVKEGDVNEYIYELYSPLSAAEFFSHPIFNIVLYNNIGKYEYEILKKSYQKVNVDMKDYVEITAKMKEKYTPVMGGVNNIKEKTKGIIDVDNQIDFDLLCESLPKTVFNERMLTKKLKELLNNLSYIYNIDTLKMCELIRMVISTKGVINKEELRKAARKYYQFNNGGLPTLVYRTQPDYLKNPVGDNSKRGKLIEVFENTSPYDFLKNKYNGVNPTQRDLRLLEMLLIDLELNPAVVNVLIDYSLKLNNNKLTSGFIETIAGQWKRTHIETASQAMEYAEKEHKSRKAKEPKTTSTKKIEPAWFDKKIDKVEASIEDVAEMQDLLKEFR